jgi:hypothetical protein
MKDSAVQEKRAYKCQAVMPCEISRNQTPVFNYFFKIKKSRNAYYGNDG